MQKLAAVNEITVYDDFAHHPTAVHATLTALRQKVGGQRILAILEPRSNTMKMGVHRDSLGPALEEADAVRLFLSPGLKWDLNIVAGFLGEKCRIFTGVQDIIDDVVATARAGDHIVIMSNGGFENIHLRLIQALNKRGS